MEISTSAVLSILGAFATATVGAITHLWRQSIAATERNLTLLKESEAKTELKLGECETKHELTDAKVLALTETVGRLRGADEVAATISSSLTTMHREMLEEIRRGEQ